MKGFRYLRGVSSLTYDRDKCVGCGACLEVCPHEVFVLEGRKVRVRDHDACMECGACANNCAPGAISVQPGVGCASYIIQTWFGKLKAASGCC